MTLCAVERAYIEVGQANGPVTWRRYISWNWLLRPIVQPAHVASEHIKWAPTVVPGRKVGVLPHVPGGLPHCANQQRLRSTGGRGGWK